MEIALLPHTALRLKGKYASLVVDGLDKASYNGMILLGKSSKPIASQGEVVVIDGPGEYEIGGIKMSGIKGGTGTVYSLKLDNVDVLLGKIQTLEKLQSKVKEHNVVIALCDSEQEGSFVTTLAANVIVFYGEKAEEVSQGLSKESVKRMAKYQTTIDKLPPEVETIVLE